MAMWLSLRLLSALAPEWLNGADYSFLPLLLYGCITIALTSFSFTFMDIWIRNWVLIFPVLAILKSLVSLAFFFCLTLFHQDIYLGQSKSDRDLKLEYNRWWIAKLRILCYWWVHCWSVTLHIEYTLLGQAGTQKPLAELIILLHRALDNCSTQMLLMSYEKKPDGLTSGIR